MLDNLKNGIYCHNTFEKLPFKKNGYRLPMVCFCDIPLSLIKEHFDWYGKYGIGIKRQYARKVGVKPVWYITRENPLVENLVRLNNLSDQERNHLLPYLKQHFGLQKKRRYRKTKEIL